MRVVAVSDVGGAVLNTGGLDVAALSEHAAATGTVRGFPGGEPLDPADIFSVECEVAVPAALEGAIDVEVARRCGAKIIVEAANGPTTADADAVLEERGVILVPDILANAGGVTSSYFEWAQNRQGIAWPDGVAADRLHHTMHSAFMAVWAAAAEAPRPAAPRRLRHRGRARRRGHVRPRPLPLTRAPLLLLASLRCGGRT